MKHRVLFVCTHPVQYAAPMFRRMAHDHRLEILVAYCSLEGAETYLDGEFGVSFAWDVPLLDDYRWICLPNWSRRLKRCRDGREFDALARRTY